MIKRLKLKKFSRSGEDGSTPGSVALGVFLIAWCRMYGVYFSLLEWLYSFSIELSSPKNKLAQVGSDPPSIRTLS
jgi:hypothetical protein